jgi:hypothetical protein
MGATSRYAVLFSLCLGAVALTACGGGGGGASALPAPANGNGSGTTSGAASSPQSVVLTIAIPAVSSSTVRRLRYVSPATKSAVVAYGTQHQTVNCTTTCTLTLSMSPGQTALTAQLYDQVNGGGNLLATGSTTATIVAGQQNAIALSFGGVPAKITVALGAASVAPGASAQIPVVVKALDAAGYTIVGSDPYANPITLTTDDHSGATSLSATTLSTPNDTVTLSYTGTASLTAVHVTASVPGTAVGSQSATLSVAAAATPAPTAAPVATPVPTPAPVAAGSFPDHVRNHAYYGLNNINADIPAAWMAAHVDTVEDDGYTAQHADAFKRAGGKFAIAYTDPTYAAHCPPPFLPPAGKCTGTIANLVQSDETAYVHDATGARVNRFVSDYFQYQEVYNVGAPSAQHAYAATTASILAASPHLDGFEADDSGSPISEAGGVFGSSLYYNFNAIGVEIASDQQWIAGESAMLGAAGKPLMINGGDSATWGPAYNGAFLDLPYVYAQQFEGCFNNAGNYLYTDSEGKFAKEENGLLAVMAHHKSAVCYPTGDTSSAHRLYAYAAWMLTYDPAYSVYEMDVPQSDGEAVYPETQLVPVQPRATAASSVTELRNGSVYVREFAQCAIAASPIGPCAAVVNSSPSATAAIPALSTAYAHQIALDPQSLYHGGKANVVAGAPASLPPATAAILVR